MRDVRVFYAKKGALKFISHLDMVRAVTRAARMADLPLWYTEGFHSHLHISFILPLSLGFTGEREAFDIRLTEDDFPLSRVAEGLNANGPAGFTALLAAEPFCKPAEVAACRYGIDFSGDIDAGDLAAFLGQKPFVVEKKGKKGTREVDISPKILKYELSGRRLTLTVTGGEDNLNPTLPLSAYFSSRPAVGYSVNREALLTASGEVFS